ncbi:MAG: HlyD family efflux transporter periplasmic adaptor subunit [Bacteroidota bacterium]
MSLPRILAVVLVLAIGGGIYFFSTQGKEKEQLTDLKTKVRKGPFTIKVTATGELQAKNSEKIMGPSGMRTVGIWQTSITDMVTEGTVVNAGDYVATLDKTELTNKIREAQTEIEKIQTQLDQARIDTTIELRALRDQLVNSQFAKKEKLLQVEQSKYEAPSVIQQAKIDLERTEREFNQLKAKYRLTQEKSQAKIAEIDASLKQQNGKYKQLTDIASGFRVMAPKPGMVIYTRSWDGKVGPGSQIRAWDPVVAELPDLTDMVSKTFVNEVDISRVKKGQEVSIKVDAFPDKEYTGQVIQVANIGEQLRGYDAKVFEVVVQVNEVDSILRPAMTTSNEIVTDVFEEVLSIPMEALHTDSLPFVYKDMDGTTVKQEVIPGLTNLDEVRIDHGLSANEEIYLSVPAGSDNLTFVFLDQSIKDEIARKQAEEAKARQARMMEKMKQVKDQKIDSGNSSGGGMIIF